jgi:hypothetical protein
MCRRAAAPVRAQRLPCARWLRSPAQMCVTQVLPPWGGQRRGACDRGAAIGGPQSGVRARTRRASAERASAALLEDRGAAIGGACADGARISRTRTAELLEVRGGIRMRGVTAMGGCSDARRRACILLVSALRGEVLSAATNSAQAKSAKPQPQYMYFCTRWYRLSSPAANLVLFLLPDLFYAESALIATAAKWAAGYCTFLACEQAKESCAKHPCAHATKTTDVVHDQPRCRQSTAYRN